MVLRGILAASILIVLCGCGAVVKLASVGGKAAKIGATAAKAGGTVAKGAAVAAGSEAATAVKAVGAAAAEPGMVAARVGVHAASAANRQGQQAQPENHESPGLNWRSRFWAFGGQNFEVYLVRQGDWKVSVLTAARADKIELRVGSGPWRALSKSKEATLPAGVGPIRLKFRVTPRKGTKPVELNPAWNVTL